MSSATRLSPRAKGVRPADIRRRCCASSTACSARLGEVGWRGRAPRNRRDATTPHRALVNDEALRRHDGVALAQEWGPLHHRHVIDGAAMAGASVVRDAPVTSSHRQGGIERPAHRHGVLYPTGACGLHIHGCRSVGTLRLTGRVPAGDAVLLGKNDPSQSAHADGLAGAGDARESRHDAAFVRRIARFARSS